MKALVLSGGSGTRLRPFSYSMPKQLIPIANRPVLEHVVESIRAMGVTEIGIVVGSWGATIADVIGDGSRFGARITYIPQDEPMGLAHCVQLARPFLGDDDFVMYLGDNMLPDGVTHVAEEFTASRPAAQVVLHRVSDPRAFGVAEVDESGAVQRLVEKPQHPKSDLALIGVYFFTKAIHQAVDTIKPSARGELEITDAIQLMLEQGAQIKASLYEGYWQDTGRAEDVLECNARLLAALTSRIDGEVDDTSELSGTVVIAAGARVVRSKLVGPIIVGADSVVEDSHIGPGTSIGTGCTLRATRITESIVLAGANIANVPGLHRSLIGRSASVSPSDRGIAQHRMVIGDNTVIEVAA
ncbi:glucose-1-phosphate thymidylyltransferase [Streptomyces sp. DG2A-72]|uniref:glucose-1-phosphate thymidylyltransferase n=1 Tax=Streptomyces sp. DG2A-72 TaxID=3051386 RepID=UPI00265B7F3E|nr:glucose-1-phosphate thymidylyltransferase [Streptomyces sp. DG2A-72]MDO0939337.1 glucose-1-phosphate thymidylyltransferase [Streptomyces sp. DG2A-72]